MIEMLCDLKATYTQFMPYMKLKFFRNKITKFSIILKKSHHYFPCHIYLMNILTKFYYSL